MMKKGLSVAGALVVVLFVAPAATPSQANTPQVGLGNSLLASLPELPNITAEEISSDPADRGGPLGLTYEQRLAVVKPMNSGGGGGGGGGGNRGSANKPKEQVAPGIAALKQARDLSNKAIISPGESAALKKVPAGRGFAPEDPFG